MVVCVAIIMAAHSWRRAALSYQDKFVHDYVLRVPCPVPCPPTHGGVGGAARDPGTPPPTPPLRFTQAPTARAAEDAFRGGDAEGASSNPGGGDRGGAARRVGEEDDGTTDGQAADAEDPIPDTAYTVWDAGIMLGMYVSQAHVWERLTRTGRHGASSVDVAGGGGGGGDGTDDTCHDKVVLELGAGTGVASLAVAASGLPALVVLSDLPAVVPFMRHNCKRNKAPAGPVPKTTALAAVPLRWGFDADVEAMPPPARAPHVVLGADLIYTEKTEVIDALIATLVAVTPVGSVAVFASCQDHRPESIEHFERQLTEAGFEPRVVAPDELAPGYGGGGESDAADFRVLEMRRVRSGSRGGGEARLEKGQGGSVTPVP